ncbi:PREDICTED: alpha-ketoglutarate-dependent dioxygenase alkB homolog 6-like [Priapulus caudatus]|uniref:Alpha-ketoglutarate-dependent dioxygenase alkB homolog 6-like n=1 Tax=Priapulus caudatus TaxID=37621 RepID=A0ABM1EGL1_PRICU|nr:PREDICTED: alpha-ketoglutarate-dependent dioxygenase alkB homolog 6-like [Priapulus caudatus]
MIPEKMPEWLDVLIQRLSGLDVFDGKIPNHVLVNEYEAGQGIMPHEDGPLFHPVISTLNIGSYTFLDFYYHISDGTSQAESCAEQERYFMSLFLQPRSLLLIKSDMYNRFLHGIGPKTQDVITDKIGNLGFCDASVGEVMERQRRISLTIRHVPHTLKVKLKLGKT